MVLQNLDAFPSPQNIFENFTLWKVPENDIFITLHSTKSNVINQWCVRMSYQDGIVPNENERSVYFYLSETSWWKFIYLAYQSEEGFPVRSDEDKR